MAAHHTRTSSNASRHTRTASTSEHLLTETVSSLQRCVFGNVFRSQRQLMRFGVFLTMFLLAVYMLGPFGSSRKVVTDPKPKATAAIRSAPDETKLVSEYRATYFEELGKRFAGKEWAVKVDAFHSNNILAPEANDDGQGQGSKEEVDLQVIGEKVRTAAQIVSKCKEVPGLSIVVVKGDHSVHIPMGLADIGTRRPVTRDTKFLLNSISKTFLGQLLGVLISESVKNLTWDTRVADILGPDFQLATEKVTREVTLRDLLSHRSGLSSGNLAVRATYPEGWTRERLIKHFDHLPLSAPFRKTFLYSNMGGTLAAHVAEVVGGAPWEKLMVKKLLAPLGMLSSLPVTTQARLEGDDFSRLYVPVEGTLTQAETRIFNQGPLAAVALLSTTSTDIAKWLQFNLRQGKLKDGRQLIRRDVWLEMWTKQMNLSPMFLTAVDKSGNKWPVKDVSEGYGLFWFINKYRGLKNLWHGGGLYSHFTMACHFPEKNVALYAVINGYSGDARPFSVVESLAYYTADLLLGYQPWLDDRSLCTYPRLPKMPQAVPKGEPAKGGMQGNVEQKPAEESVEDDDKERMKSFRKGGDVGSDALRFAGERNPEISPGGGSDQQNIAGDSDFAAANDEDLPESNLAGVDNKADKRSLRKLLEGGRQLPKLPLKSYEGHYYSPLFGNFSIFKSSNQLHCQMNVLTGDLHYAQGHTFDVELTKSLRFLSKPSKTAAASRVFGVTFVENMPGEITAVDVHSSWAMEVPLQFRKLR